MGYPAEIKAILTGARRSVLMAGIALGCVVSQPASAAQTKSWVVSWFTFATDSQPGDCSKGLTPLFDKVIREYMKALGKTPEEADNIANETGKNAALVIMRGRIDGKPVNVYANPEATEYYKARLNPMDGKFAYGFNLDGKGDSSPNSYEDPETHQKGINNQLIRTVGCVEGFRATPPERSLVGGGYQWTTIRDSMPAWLISVTGDDLSKDGDVTVKWERALDHVTVDASSQPRADSTFEVDPDPRWHNTFHGKMKDGVITIEPAAFSLESDPYFVPVFDIQQTHLRMKVKPDGSLDGVMGGYQAWKEIYWSFASGGYNVEGFMGFDMPSLYRTFKEFADGYPDSSGQNQRISVAYHVEAIPAFVVPAASGKNNKTAQAQ